MTNDDWMPVIGISVALMALIQLGIIIALVVALRRMQTGIAAIEKRVEGAVDEFRPQIARVVEEAKTASASAQELVADVRRRVQAVEEAADSVRKRVNKVVDGVQTVTNNLPSPMKASGPAAMAVWAGVRMAKGVLGRVAERRREQHIRERQLREAESYSGIV